MLGGERSYIAIDLKSFYASVECVARGLDPLDTMLVVADKTRTEKTICLAVSPALKAHGVPGRPRLFEVVEKVRQANAVRQKSAPDGRFSGLSSSAAKLNESPELGLGYIIAKPRMAHYIEVSTKVYQVYLKYVAPEDIHVYSIDEVFIDVTDYLKTYRVTARELAMRMILDVLTETGITATAGIGTNLYLAKIAMDIVAKHIPPDRNGVRISELDEMSYRRLLWDHRPITDFWRVGRGYAKRLEKVGMYTMGDVALCSVGGERDFYNEDLLYKIFGVNAELLIDHAWGWEPCGIADIKGYKPGSHSMGSGQVLSCPYDFTKAKLVAREMADLLVLDLVGKRKVTNRIELTIGYDAEDLKSGYSGRTETDRYGREVPKQAHGSHDLSGYTSSTKEILAAVSELFDRIVDRNLTVRRLYVVANNVIDETDIPKPSSGGQLTLFTDVEAEERRSEEEKALRERERRMQEAMLGIRERFGKNAILRGMNLEEGATARDRNSQIGGHKA